MSENLIQKDSYSRFTIDSQNDVYIPQENFIRYINNQIFDCLFKDDDFIKSHIVLETLSEGINLAKKLRQLESNIEKELNRYKSKEIQECNASLRHLRQEKDDLEDSLSTNEAYNSFLHFDFHSICQKTTIISADEVVAKRNDKEFYKNIESAYKSDLFTALSKLLEINTNEVVLTPQLLLKNGELNLSFIKQEDNADVMIAYKQIVLKDSVFKAYKAISANLKELEKNAACNKNIPEYLKNLNKSQRYAVTYPNEHILVLAGAGCGKTTTIISRAAYLISTGIAPNRIQILTFTKKAAFEITERVNNCLGTEYSDLNSATFHRWCIDILKSAPEIFGYINFTIIDREEQLQIFKKHRQNQKNTRFPKTAKILDAYSFARNTRSSLSKVMETNLSEYLNSKEKIAELMRAYEKEKREHNYLDYDDILDIVATAINESDEVCKWLAQKYDYILVDEMQDTNPLQWTLLEPLSKYTKLFCVGDDAQAIYGFRGADFENIHSFQKRIPNSVVIKLEDNYRSTQEILDVSNWLLKSSQIPYAKELKAIFGSGKKPELHSFVNIFEESQWIANDLLERFKNDKIWENKLVLVRSAYSGRNIEVECLKNAIPYIFIGGQKLFESAHIRDLLSLLRLSSNYKDELAWLRFLTLFYGVGGVGANRVIQKIITCSDKSEVIEILNAMLNENCGIIETYQKLQSVDSLQESIDIAVQFLDELLMYKYGVADWQTRKSDFVFLKQLANDFSTITEFCEEFLLNPVFSSQKNREEKTKNFLTISTIHSAKGTENDVVYISDVSIGRYPTARDIVSFEKIEEERRVLYVAMTRAKKELIITRNAFAPLWGDETLFQNLRLKYFLREIPPYLITEKQHPENHSEFKNSYIQKTETLPAMPEKFKVKIIKNQMNSDTTKKIKVRIIKKQINSNKTKKTQSAIVLTDEEKELKKIYDCSKISIGPLLKRIKDSENSKSKIQTDIGLGHNYLDKLTEKSKPLFDNLKRFADYFGIDVSDCFYVLEKGDVNQDNINPIVTEYMASHKQGDLYPKEIKDAILSEYKPNIYGFKKIGKKYGISHDVIKTWWRGRK